MVTNLAEQLRPVLTVYGIDGEHVRLDGADLLKLPRHTIKVPYKGMLCTFEGVRLFDVLTKVRLPTGEKFFNTAAWYYVLAKSSNGNRAVFAWAELDETFTDKTVYVVMTRNGESFADTDSPFQLVVPHEKMRTTRWLHQLMALSVRQAN